jgi:Arc/MetJ-type ribon-helix-helix transcriptional regulator
MGAIQLPDDLQRAIDRQVEEGRAASPSAFLQEAVMRLIEDADAEDADILNVTEAGIADIEAGRFTIVATPEDSERLYDRLAARLRENLTATK